MNFSVPVSLPLAPKIYAAVSTKAESAESKYSIDLGLLKAQPVADRDDDWYSLFQVDPKKALTTPTGIPQSAFGPQIRTWSTLPPVTQLLSRFARQKLPERLFRQSRRQLSSR